MERELFLENLRNGEPVTGQSDGHRMMHELAQEAMRLTAKLNASYHDPEEIRETFSEIIGKPVDEAFALFPPFYTDCGKNIFVGSHVFINCGCHFQDQGGIYIGDHALIGSQVVLATINHGMEPEKRGDNIPAPIRIEKNVWIGSHATVLAGVTIGKNAVVAAGAVVTKDVPANTVVAGVPARQIRKLNS